MSPWAVNQLNHFWEYFLNNHIIIIFTLLLCFKMIQLLKRQFGFYFIDSDKTHKAIFLIAKMKGGKL